MKTISTFIVSIHSPRHRWLLQSLNMVPRPGQSLPPGPGGGLSHLRLHSCDPGPHVVLQMPQRSHSPQLPLITTKNVWMFAFFFLLLGFMVTIHQIYFFAIFHFLEGLPKKSRVHHSVIEKGNVSKYLDIMWQTFNNTVTIFTYLWIWAISDNIQSLQFLDIIQQTFNNNKS